MQLSTETRWILSANEMNIAEKWFLNFGEKFSEKNDFPRQDYYLKTNSKTLGIKIREPKKDGNGNVIAKLELKTLVQDLGAYKFDNQNIGTVNNWVKYSFDLDSKTNPLDVLQNVVSKEITMDWILIEKDRLLVKFDLDNKKIVSGKEMINNGAGIELTKFLLENKVYYSLGIEAFGDKESIEKTFFNTMQFLFNSMKISSLLNENSKSYPEIVIEK